LGKNTLVFITIQFVCKCTFMHKMYSRICLRGQIKVETFEPRRKKRNSSKWYRLLNLFCFVLFLMNYWQVNHKIIHLFYYNLLYLFFIIINWFFKLKKLNKFIILFILKEKNLSITFYNFHLPFFSFPKLISHEYSLSIIRKCVTFCKYFC